MKLLYDKEGASNILSISVSMLDRLVSDGKIKQIKVGGRTLFKLIDLQTFVDQLGNDQDKPEAKKKMADQGWQYRLKLAPPVRIEED